MNALKTISLLLFFLAFLNSDLSGQTKYLVKGRLVDSADRKSIPNASISLIGNKDTLSMVTDDDGRFMTRTVTSAEVVIAIKYLGFKPYTAILKPSKDQTEINLDPIILYPETNMLKEVVIKGKVVPIKVMKDTIEYNTAAYLIREGDYVEDLLRQLPGVELDANGNVSTLGKGMTKLRINGKDFFTSNVQEFIKRLPADMFSHLQIIDDYGDEANFTGIKIGEPTKILNLVTKPGRNKGKFGSLNANGGTNNSYGMGANLNIWNGNKQYSGSSGYNNTNNSAGYNSGRSLGANARDQLGKKLTGAIGYSFNNHGGSTTQLSNVETLNTLGTIYSINDNTNNSAGNNHSVSMNLNGTLAKKYFGSGLSITTSANRASNMSSSLQTGILHQDILNESTSRNSTPNLNGNLSWGIKTGKMKRTIMFNANGSLQRTSNSQDILTNIRYYKEDTEQILKDSLLNRLVSTRNNNKNFSGNFSYSEPLSKPADSIQKSIDVGYSLSVGSSNNELETRVRNQDNIYLVDSLSNVYTSTSINHNLRIGYRYGAKKLNYNLGFTFQPNTLIGTYEGRSDKVNQTTFNSSPSLNFNYVMSPSQSMNMSYRGSSRAPDFYQLQPVPDTRDLQNVIIGNPELKTSFSHYFNTGYRIFHVTTGRALQLHASANTVQNQVISNIALIRDTLNSLKRETRFLNINGNYGFSGGYSISIPFQKRKYNISINGGGGYSNQVLFTDNIRNLNKGFNYNQSLNTGLNNKWLSLDASVNYNFNGSVYSLDAMRTTSLQSWSFGMDSRIRIRKSFSATISGNKSINKGRDFNGNNPLLINLNINKSLLKNNLVMISLQANDLLNQGNYFSRFISNNAITDSRTRQVSRYFILRGSLNLERFGL